MAAADPPVVLRTADILSEPTTGRFTSDTGRISELLQGVRLEDGALGGLGQYSLVVELKQDRVNHGFQYPTSRLSAPVEVCGV